MNVYTLKELYVEERIRENKMLVVFVILVSIGGSFGFNLDCYREEVKKCDDSLLPTEFPKTEEEVQTVCRNLRTYADCNIDVQESCGKEEDALNEMRESLDYMTSLCDENNHIHKVVSRNLGCIAPLAETMKDACNVDKYSEENEEAWVTHVEQITEDYNNTKRLFCIHAFWDVSCPPIVLGVHCGSETREAVAEVLQTTNHRYVKSCTPDVVEELQPLYDTIEAIIQAQQGLENAIKRRK